MVIIGAPFLMAASSAMASLDVTLYDQNDGQPSGYRDTSAYGGEFQAVLSGNTTFDNYVIDNYSSLAKTVNTDTGQTGIETFCVEVNEAFRPGTSYNAQVSSQVVPGGPHQYLTVGTAWLYSQFAQGILSGYCYTAGSGREFTADELQDAIWYLQGEINSSGGVIEGNLISSVNDSAYTFSTSDPFLIAAEEYLDNGKTGTAALNVIEGAATNGEYGVYALDLSTTDKGSTVYAQDQLIYCPVPESATLAAGAMLLIPLGLSTVRALRKSRIPQKSDQLPKGFLL